MRPPLRLVLPIASALLVLILVLAIVLGSSGGNSPSRSDSGATELGGGFDGAVLPAGVHAPDFTLTDQSGASASLNSYRGRVVVLVFLSSSCRACVLVAQQVRGALDELAPRTGQPTYGSADGVQAIFVSTDPARDTRARVSRFLSETSLSARAEYLTSTDLARLRDVWRAYEIPPAPGGKRASQSAASVLLIDRDGYERVEFGIEQLTPESLAHDIRKLQPR